MNGGIAGKIIGLVLIALVIGAGVFVMSGKDEPAPTQANNQPVAVTVPTAKDDLLTETLAQPQKLGVSQAYIPKDNVIDIELSEYAGYSGIIVANGGLAPTENSIFFRKYGFKVKITISENESWEPLNQGKMAASATTVDVLSVYGKDFNVVVPSQIAFSRGSDGIVVNSKIDKVNDLKGRILATCQFTEADFFIRYLAQESGIPVVSLTDLQSTPDPLAINLVYAVDGFSSGDLLLKDTNNNWDRLAGCVTWSPKTEEIVENSGGKLKILTTNRNLLVIADVLIVNRGFAEKYPQMVSGLVAGILEGNGLIRENPEKFFDVIASSFKWQKSDVKGELAKVHLSNLPENIAFFSGEMDSAGSFSSIYSSAMLAYGSKTIRNPVSADKFMDTKWLMEAKATKFFDNEKISIAPVRIAGSGSVEKSAILSKNIRFLFEPNSSKLDQNDEGNKKSLDSIKSMLAVAPGSSVLLRGHVDNAQKAEFAKGGEARVRQGALRAMKLSTERAIEIKEHLILTGVSADKIDSIGAGWEEPISEVNEENRRVEVQWFTLE